MRPLLRGDPLPDARIYTEQGEPLGLQDLWAEQPVLIVTGSLTCPPSRVFNPALNDLRRRFGNSTHICLLYVIDAHPSDSACPYTGTTWVTEDNEAEQLFIPQPVTLEERIALARRFAQQAELDVPVYIDDMNNAAWDALGRSPNMAVLVGTDGCCRLYQDWIMPNALASDLESELAN